MHSLPEMLKFLYRSNYFEEQKKLVVQYCNENFINQGMCADICFHDMKKGNPHAHILLTLRPINKDGTWGQKQKKEYILDNVGIVQSVVILIVKLKQIINFFVK
jgi:hypothetical protein